MSSSRWQTTIRAWESLFRRKCPNRQSPSTRPIGGSLENRQTDRHMTNKVKIASGEEMQIGNIGPVDVQRGRTTQGDPRVAPALGTGLISRPTVRPRPGEFSKKRASGTRRSFRVWFKEAAATARRYRESQNVPAVHVVTARPTYTLLNSRVTNPRADRSVRSVSFSKFVGFSPLDIPLNNFYLSCSSDLDKPGDPAEFRRIRGATKKKL